MSTRPSPPRPGPPAAATSGTPAIDRVVAMARRRMRLNRALSVTGPAALVAGVAASLWLVVGRVVLLPDLDGVVVAAAVGLATVAVGAAAAVRIPAGWAAWAADRWLQTRDAFATAVELREGPRSRLADDQAAAAETLAAEVTGWPQGPNVPRRRLLAGAAAVLVAVGLAAAPNPQDEVRARRVAEEALVTAEAEQLRDEADALRAVGDPEQDALADQLDALADQLETGDLDDALDDLADARAQLEQQLAEDLASQRTALSGLQQELAREPLAEGDSVRAQLEQLGQEAGAGEHDGDQGLADRLDALADALASGQPEVADALSQASDALQSGDQAGAEQALGEASDAVGRALDQLADQEATQDAAGAVDQAQDRLGEAQDQLDRGEIPDALQPGQGRRQGQGDGQGQGQGDGQRQGQGQGQGDGQGQGGAGGGGAGGNPSGEKGQGGANDGGGTPNADTPGRLDLETVYDPPSGDLDGQDVHLRGNDDGTGDSDTVGTSQGRGIRTHSLVPYLDVLTDYRQRATRTIERPGFPVELRDLVRNYFDQIGRTR